MKKYLLWLVGLRNEEVARGRFMGRSRVTDGPVYNELAVQILPTSGAYGQSINQATVNSVTNGITAFAGGGQAGATLLTSVLNRVTVVVTMGDSVKLPSASVAGMRVDVNNQGANACQIFGSGTDTINGVAASVGISQATGLIRTYTCTVIGNWEVSAGGAPLFALNTLNQTTGTIPAGIITGAAQVQVQQLNATPGSQTTRTATQLFSDQPGAVVGGAYSFTITNTGAGTLTLVGGTGVTLTGTATVPTNTWREFVVVFNTATTATATAVATGTYS